MKTTRWLRSIPGVLPVAWLVAMTAVSAQGDRITIQLMPKSNQVVRYHTVQEVRFALPFPVGAPDPSPSPRAAAIFVATESVHTLAVNAPDAQGHAEARFMFDQLTMQM